MKPNITIEEYSEKFKEQIRHVIGKTLADISVVARESLLIDDPDLEKIPEVYSGRGRFWVAIEQGKVIGTVALRDLGDDVARLNRMFVLLERHGSGLGQQLLDHATDFAKKMKYNKIILDSHYKMKRAHRFYEKNNFIKVKEEKDKYFF